MNDDAPTDGRAELAAAQQTIAQQAQEIERLRRRLADERFAEELRDVLSLAATAGTIASPVTHGRLLEMIVATAANVINAHAASLFLIDEEAQELIFEVALGEKAEEVKRFRVPLGQGIAGLVALSGQPMAIADTEEDARVGADIAQAVGYKPRNILCVPLFYADQIIGVLELLDKEGANAFSAQDMEALGLFANQAAVAIEQSRAHQNVASLIGSVLQSLGGTSDTKHRLGDQARVFAAGIQEDVGYRRALDVAGLVQDIAGQGENELMACEAILKTFAEYLHARSQPLEELSGLGLGGLS